MGRGVVWRVVLVVLLSMAGQQVLAEQDAPLELLAPSSPTSPSGQSAGAAPGQGAPEFHDIRGPVAVSIPSDFLVPMLIVAETLGLSALGWYLWRRRKRSVFAIPLAHERALSELAAVRAALNPEQTREQAARLAEILRGYLEARFVLPVTRQTTREFFAGLSSHQRLSQEMDGYRQELQTCLELADVAKFALRIPTLEDLETMEEAVRSFVEASGQPTAARGKP